MEPRRPKLWMHRTRRFWFGLTVLIGLVACWVATGYRGGYLHLILPHSPDRPDEVIITITRGTFTTIWESKRMRPRGSYSSAFLSAEWVEAEGLIFKAGNFYQKSTYGSLTRRTITLPLWPIPILWVFFWIFWMARMDRKEAAHFAKLR